MKAPSYVYINFFETAIFVYTYPFMICVIFYFPMLYLIKELLKDDKSKRMTKICHLGLGKDTIIVSWIAVQFIIVLYYTIMINAVGYQLIAGAANFFVTFLYGMTTFGSAFIIV